MIQPTACTRQEQGSKPKTAARRRPRQRARFSMATRTYLASVPDVTGYKVPLFRRNEYFIRGYIYALTGIVTHALSTVPARADLGIRQRNRTAQKDPICSGSADEHHGPMSAHGRFARVLDYCRLLSRSGRGV